MTTLEVDAKKIPHDPTTDALASVVPVADLFRKGAIRDWPDGFILSVEKPEPGALLLLAKLVARQASVSHNANFQIEDLSNSTAINFKISLIVPDPIDSSKTSALIPKYNVSVVTGQKRATYPVFVTGGTDRIEKEVLSEVKKLLSA
jgi:hypothetical protein